MARARLRRGHEDSGKNPSVSREGFAGTHASSAVLGVSGECSGGIAWHWSGADHVQNAGGIGKGHQTNSGFSAQRATRSATGRIHNALRLKLHGAPAALKDRANCFDITSSAIIAQYSIVSDTHQSRRQDMQAETPDELQGGEG